MNYLKMIADLADILNTVDSLSRRSYRIRVKSLIENLCEADYDLVVAMLLRGAGIAVDDWMQKEPPLPVVLRVSDICECLEGFLRDEETNTSTCARCGKYLF